jgi:hypothetical protein
MFFLPCTYFKYIFHVKTQHFVTLKSDEDPDLDLDLAPWIRIRIRIEIKSWIWIRIRIETNTDPQHCKNPNKTEMVLRFFPITVPSPCL